MAADPPPATPLAAPERRRLRLPGTIRFRITAVATAAVVVVLVVTGAVLVAAQRQLLTENLEDTLRRRAADVASLVRAGELPPLLAFPGDEDTLAQVVSPDGTVLAASPNAREAPPFADPAAEDGFRNVRGLPGDDDTYRLLARRVEVAPGPGDGAHGAEGDEAGDAGDAGPGEERPSPAVVFVASAVDDVEEAVGVAATTLTIAVPVVSVVLAAVVWVLVGRTLHPVESIRARVEDIGGEDLARRVPVPAGDDEVARLARTMNAMLDRLEDATARQQRFVADASHELRSPLTRIRAELEVAMAHPESADPVVTQRSVLEEASHLQHLVDDLLQLARSDAGLGPTRREPVDVDDLVLREAQRLRAGGRVAVDLSGVSAAQVWGDADQLARAVRNLGENAERHAGSQVAFTLVERDATAELTVSDDGPGIAPADRERVFERFARLDDSRSTHLGGTGLGLAITREIATRHGGSIELAPSERGARFVVTLPLERREGPGASPMGHGAPPRPRGAP